MAALSLVPLALVAWAWSLTLARALPRADFVFNNGTEVSSLDPAAANGIPEGRVIRALYEGLYTREPIGGNAVPALAANTELSADRLTYIFKLKPGIVWSNGDPLTAADFEWNFRRLLDPETASPFAGELWCIRGARELNTGRDAADTPVEPGAVALGVKATDDATLVIELVAPTAHFLELLAAYQLSPVHRASLEAARKRSPQGWTSEWTRPGALVGNGPYVLAERRLNDRIRLVKNERYWDADSVAMRTIDALAIEDATTAFNLYFAGEVDWLDGNVPASLIDRLLARDDFDPEPYFGLYFYRVNTTKPPLDDPRVRRALYATINRVQICDRLLEAGQKPAYTLVPWGHMGSYSSPPAKKEDLEGARQALAEAGFGPEGKPIGTLRILYNSSEQNRSIAELVANDWSEYLDIDVDLENQEWKSYVDRQSNLQYDVSRSSWICDYLDVLNFFAVFTSESDNNRTGWKNADYDKLIAEARGIVDPGARNALLRRAETILLDELPILPIYSYVSQNLVDPRVGGFGVNPLNEQNPKYWYWMDEPELARSRRAQNKREKKVSSHGPKEGLYSPKAQAERKAGGRTRK
ncbi:MAG: peptide ABC transporter substrate-binding protein [Planctomycetes bacterium]|nr:peptide ABC transporter substrate-binding protein [Planctomycetota bacterium]